MTWHALRRLGSRIRGLLAGSRDADEREFDQELDAHLAMLEEDLQGRGMPPEEAARAARVRLGGRAQLRDTRRELRGVPWLDAALRDLGYALRTLVKSPGFTTVTVLTLALGIGANAAIFSAVDALLLKPLPFPDPGRLVSVLKKNPPRGWTRNPVSPIELIAWRSTSGAFAELAAYKPTACVLRLGSEVEEDPCEVAAADLFPVLGMAPALGRGIAPDEDAEGAPRVAVIGHRLWQRRFGGDPNAIGRTVLIDGKPHAVVGVMPATVSHAYASPYGPIPELWVSGIGLSPASTWNDYMAVGRLAPGVVPSQVEAALDPVSAGIGEAHPDLRGWRVELRSLRTQASGDARPALLVLMGSVSFVLLIACANVANLLLARGALRASELAVRTALGASRARLFRQLLTESLLLAAVGGALGVLLATGLQRALVALAPPYLVQSAPGLASGAPDARVLGFALLATLGTTLLFGAGPALQGARREAASTLKQSGRATLGPRGLRLRSALVVSEIALAVVLLIGAGLMIRTLAGLRRVDLGFEPARVLTLRLTLAGERYREPETQAELWRRVTAAVAALPGVESASAARGLPMGDWAGQFFTTAARPSPPAGQVPDANYVVAGADYFRTLRIPIRTGRAFDARDLPSATPVAIVNEQLARLHWPGQDPLGKRIRMGTGSDASPWLTVVGVAGNVRSGGPDDAVRSEVYVPSTQPPWLLRPETLLVRTASDPALLARAVEAAIHRVDPEQPVAAVQTLEDIARLPLLERRMVMALLGGFAALAFLLSALGVYGVLAYAVAQRTREIGLRMALGAARGDVVRMVVGRGVRLVGLGLAAGAAGALALGRVMADLLFGVRAADPATFAAVGLLVAGASLAACYLPARRASAVEPVVALRRE